MSEYHIPVMLVEVINLLDIKPGKWYIDCNLGGGGHTKEILNRGGKVLGIDLDADSIHRVAKDCGLQIKYINNHFQARSEHLILYQGNFASVFEIASQCIQDNVYGVLFDLGVSSYQLETPERGFSFNAEAPLDMRMDRSKGVNASDLVNGLYENELANLFLKYGEENFAKPIAKKISLYRSKKRIETTQELSSIILSVRHRGKLDRTHPATRVFQALRIAVNDEIINLENALPRALDVLAPKGRLVVISFHSLEDRIVKQFFQKQEEGRFINIITDKPLTSTKEEIDSNPRSRSAKLRAVEKTQFNYIFGKQKASV
jgi:16S rRNA (cytosine1402-N4)-methyltransferase